MVPYIKNTVYGQKQVFSMIAHRWLSVAMELLRMDINGMVES